MRVSRTRQAYGARRSSSGPTSSWPVYVAVERSRKRCETCLIVVTDEQRRTIEACEDQAQIEHWADRAFDVKTAAELFA